MKNNQKGFSAIELVLITLAVLAIGGVGYFVLQSRKTANNAYNNAASVVATTKPATSSQAPALKITYDKSGSSEQNTVSLRLYNFYTAWAKVTSDPPVGLSSRNAQLNTVINYLSSNALSQAKADTTAEPFLCSQMNLATLKIGTPVISGTTATVKVVGEEPGGTGGTYEHTCSITLVNQGSTWRIDKYDYNS